MNNKLINIILVLLAGIGWGMIGIPVRALQQAGLSSFQVSATRCVLTAIALMVFLAIFKKDQLKINYKDLPIFLGTGILSITFFNVCYFFAISKASLSVAAILLYTAPAIVVFLSAIFLKQKITFKKIISVIVAFIGCAIVCLAQGEISLSFIGVIAGLGSGLGYALYSIFGTFALKKYSALTTITYTFIVASVTFLFANPKQVVVTVFSENKLIAQTVFLTMVATLLPYLLYTLALSKIKAENAAVIASTEPVCAALVGVVVFKEVLTIQVIIGLVFVLMAIVIGNISFKKFCKKVCK